MIPKAFPAGNRAMAKRSPEQLKEDDDRTTSMDLFNTAEAYRLAAIKLGEPTVWGGDAHKPVQFLYCHAIELYLKALLRQRHSVETITNKFRHDTRRLVREAENLGLFVTARDRDIFATLADTDALIEMRYIRTGPKALTVNLQSLSQTCKSVRDSVANLLRNAGVPVP
jgi:hypothetical protein